MVLTDRWNSSSSGKQDSLSVLTVSSSHCPYRMIIKFSHGTSTFVHIPYYFLYYSTGLSWYLITAKVASHVVWGTIMEWITQCIPPWRSAFSQEMEFSIKKSSTFNKLSPVNIPHSCLKILHMVSLLWLKKIKNK